MLFGEPTKKVAGIILWGDYHDLNNLYENHFNLIIHPQILRFKVRK